MKDDTGSLFGDGDQATFEQEAPVSTFGLHSQAQKGRGRTAGFDNIFFKEMITNMGKSPRSQAMTPKQFLPDEAYNTGSDFEFDREEHHGYVN